MSDAGTGPRVVSLGSVNVDRFHDVDRATVERYAAAHDWFPAADETATVDRVPELDLPVDAVAHGGKGANQAVAAAAAGADAAVFGRVGHDAAEAGVFDALVDAGVDVGRLEVADVPTGTAHVVREPDGRNRILVAAGANGTVDAAYVDRIADAVAAADCLLLQNEIPVPPVRDLLERLADRADRPTVVLDPSPVDGVEPLVERAAVDYCTPNEHEYDRLAATLSASDGVLVRTHGPAPVVVERDGEAVEVSPPSVDAADTTGAGDVLVGYLGTRLAAGADLRTAVADAVVAASLSVRDAGARGGVPALSAVRAFREANDGAG